MKCFYHNADLDGKCSAAIIKLKYPECELFGINYNDEFPFNIIQQDELIYMVDFSLPIKQMIKLRNICNFWWYDHHSQIIKEANKLNFNPMGKRVINAYGACRLVWYDIFPNLFIPEAVKYISEFDVYKFYDENTILFENGLNRFDDTTPENIELWNELLIKNNKIFTNSIINDGKIITSYLTNYFYKNIQKNTFEKTIKFNDYSYRAIFINHFEHRSLILEDFKQLEKYDLQIFFNMINQEEYKVSLFTKRDTLNCGEIARHFNGGGHDQAAGFITKINPIKLFKESY
jgi:oligoribonuclease NrnB/cAMP/cGMP phosphodiesterase (DHH superfamily)